MMREFSTDDLDALLLDRDDLAVFLSAGVVEERRLRFRLTILGLPGRTDH
ncbi:MAG: hypothetical protein WAS07_04205 [Micropruina sp.]|nr:hypothetical protein [Micropruina sp.]